MTNHCHPADLEIMARAKRYRAWLLSLIEPHIGSTVIEVGAGTGNIASLYASRLRRGVLLEPDPLSYATLAKIACGHNWNVSSYNTDLHGYLALAQLHARKIEIFDSALYINVLEHIKDDVLELARVHDVLQRGGRIILYVPACPWLFSTIDRALGHYRRYNKLSLAKVVTAAGFKITTLHYVNAIGIPGWLINRLLGRTTQAPSLIALYDRLLTPLINLVDKVTLQSVGLSLFAVAQRL